MAVGTVSEVMGSTDLTVVVVSVSEDNSMASVVSSIAIVVSGLIALLKVNFMPVVGSDFAAVIFLVTVSLSIGASSEFVVSSVISLGSVVVGISEVVGSFGVLVMVVVGVDSVRLLFSISVGDVVTLVIVAVLAEDD